MEKKFFVFQIIASEFDALNCLYEADNVCHWLWMCKQKALGFCVSLKETFSDATTFTVINKYCKGAAVQIATVCWPICRVVFLTFVWNTPF